MFKFTLTKDNFKSKYSFEERCKEVTRVLEKYPDRVPIICEKLNNDQPTLDKSKYLVPWDLTIGQFLWVIRKRMSLTQNQAIYVTINGRIPPTSSVLGHFYNDMKDGDGFLYLKYTTENTFG